MCFYQLGIARFEPVVTTNGDMGDNSLPTDVTECHRLLLAAFKQAVQLERHAATVEQRATQAEQLTTQAEKHVAASKQEVAELKRVLDETAASFEELQQEHTARLEELAWYKRWVHGRRRERVIEGEGQQHCAKQSLGKGDEM